MSIDIIPLKKLLTKSRRYIKMTQTPENDRTEFASVCKVAMGMEAGGINSSVDSLPGRVDKKDGRCSSCAYSLNEL